MQSEIIITLKANLGNYDKIGVHRNSALGHEERVSISYTGIFLLGKVSPDTVDLMNDWMMEQPFVKNNKLNVNETKY